MLVVGGQSTPARSGKTFPVSDPATGSHLADVADADEADLMHAVSCAQKGSTTWSRLPLPERAAALREATRRIREDAERLAFVDSIGSGNPITAVRREVDRAADEMDYACALAAGVRSPSVPMDGRGYDFTVREPYGLVGRIIPFNHPIMFAISKIAAPLVMGNSVILKPSPYGCISVLEVARIFNEVLPPGAINVLTDAGAAVGRALVRHPGVKRIAFTGSPAVAQRIMAEGAAGGIKHFSFELGGKNPLLVFPDVDVESAAGAAVAGMNLTATLGQSCGSTSRAFVHASLHDEFVERVRAKFDDLRAGTPTSYDSQIGCLNSDRQFERVLGYVKQGVAEGATLVTGGAKPDGDAYAGGFYFRPTLFSGVTQDMTIAREEIFGPVLSVLRWEEETEMLRAANDISLGLTANILTNDLNAALRAASAIEAGYVWVNARGGAHIAGAPFGGYKNSGLGREESVEELESYTQLKNICIWT